MTTTSKAKTIRPATTNGKISAESMVIALVRSGVPMENIALVRTFTAEQLARVTWACYSCPTMEREIAGKTYTVKICGRCNGTGQRHDSTNADKIDAGPYAGRCTCSSGEILTLRPAADIAHSMAVEINAAILARESQEIGEMPDWMC